MNNLTNFPLVTVNILSFNRVDELRITLTKVYEQDYKNIEVIVVDNASTDGTQEMVKEEFPDVNLIELNENIGIAGWNKGFEIARGEYVLVLDDDSYPINNVIESSLEMMNSDPKVGVISLKVFNQYKNEIENDFNHFEIIRGFIGCGALIRKKILETIGYFEPLIFLYVHELEFSIRVYEAGYKIIHNSEGDIFHQYSQIHREKKDISLIHTDSRKIYYDTRNFMLILLKYFPLGIAVDRIIRVFIGKIVKGIYMKNLISPLGGTLDFLKLIPAILIRRKKISKRTLLIYGKGKYIAGFRGNGSY